VIYCGYLVVTDKHKREMNKQKKNIKNYISLLLLITMIVLGIWKCPNQKEKKEKIEIPEEENNLNQKTPTNVGVVLEQNHSIPRKKEINDSAQKTQSEVKKEQKEKIESPITKTEKNPSKEILNSEEIKEFEETPKREIPVYKVNNKIDRRPPATSDISCKADMTLKIDKPSNQTSVAFSPDGTKFTIGNNNNYASVFDIEGKELFKLTGHLGYVPSVAYSPNGKFIVTGSIDNTVKVWDANTGKEIRTLAKHSDAVFSVAYSPNGKYILTGSFDNSAICSLLNEWEVYYYGGRR